MPASSDAPNPVSTGLALADLQKTLAVEPLAIQGIQALNLNIVQLPRLDGSVRTLIPFFPAVMIIFDIDHYTTADHHGGCSYMDSSTSANKHHSQVWVKYEWDLRLALGELMTPAQYSFRSAGTDELTDVVEVVLSAYGSDPIRGQMIKDIEKRMNERIPATLGRAGTDYIVAEYGERIVAVSGIAVSHWTQQNFLTGLCVLPAHQRRGLGKYLLYLSLCRLRESGAERATVYTELGSIADSKLYPKFGSVRQEGVVYPALQSPSQREPHPPVSATAIKRNVYFDGKVQSLGFSLGGHYTTIGVISPGTYRFSADLEEHVTVLKGSLAVRIGEAWREVVSGDAYLVPRGTSFEVQTQDCVAYVCEYKSALKH